MTESAAFTVLDLCAAAESGNVEQMQRILARAPGLATQDTAPDNEHQALHFAVYGGHVEAVKILLDAGADPVNGIYPHREATTARTLAFDRGLGAILDAIDAHLATQRGTSDVGLDLTGAADRGSKHEVRQILADNPDDIDARDRQGRTALHRAVSRADLGLTTQLLDRGAAIDSQDADGWRPLQRALLHSWKVPDADYPGFTAVAGLLIGRGAHYDLWAAAGMGDIDGVRQRLASAGAILDGTHGQDNPVMVAAFRGHARVLRELLAAGADADVPHTMNVAGEDVLQWGQPLWLAANRGHLEAVEVLLAGGARAEVACYASGSAVEQAMLHGAIGDTLTYCVTGDIAGLAERLHAHPREADSILWSAILAGNETVVAHHLAHGETVPAAKQPDLLQQAVRGWRLGDLKICGDGWDRRSYHRNLQRLVDAGFDLNLPHAPETRSNYTILHHLAARACKPSIYGHTAEEVVDFARILIDGGAQIDALEAQLHATPLGWAARYGQQALCALLLSRGADVNLAGADWAHPLAWAERYDHEEIAQILRGAGAR